MTTAIDLITLALKDIGALGIGQSVSPDDTADALATLNMMLGQFSANRLDVYHLVDLLFQSTGAQSYTIGTGGNFNFSRPIKIQSAFARLNGLDYPLQVVDSREEYNRVTLKTLVSKPQFVFYDAAYPLGNLYFYPIPNSSYELHVTTMDVLQQFVTPADVINLPDPYKAFIRFNLGVWLAPSYQIAPMPQLVALATQATRTVKRMNFQLQQMMMPPNIVPNGRYNIIADGVN
ncbi:MAG: hypothetical protein KGI50_05960 [Patescibacteria group bacterium]|nr:hypothetical protein [Patescibacteria group bacterium]